MTVDLVVGEASSAGCSLEVDESRDPFGPGDRRLLEDVGAQVGTLVQAVAMSGELQRSRQRLVMAQEEERRRLRRDLHDGLGPSLATIAMRLESTRDLIEEDPEEAAAASAGSPTSRVTRSPRCAGSSTGCAPRRSTSSAWSPPFASGLTEDAVGAPRSGRHRLAWRVVADGEVEPLPAAVEVAAYRIAWRRSRTRSATATPRPAPSALRREDGALAGGRARRRDGAGRDPRPGCRPDLDEGARGGARRVVHRDVGRRGRDGRRGAPARRRVGGSS